MKRIRSMLALLLILCLVLPMVPVRAAEAAPAVTAPEVSAPEASEAPGVLEMESDWKILRYVDPEDFYARGHIARFETEETLSSYVFLNPDGSKTVYYMDEPVKFQDADGRVWEKDLSLTAVEGGYTTALNDVSLTLPADPASGIRLSHGTKQITLIPQGGTLKQAAAATDSSVTYPDYYGEGMSLRYTPTLSGVKGEVVGDSTANSFTLYADGLNLYRGADGWYLAESARDNERIKLGGDLTAGTLVSGESYTVTLMGGNFTLTFADSTENLSAEGRVLRELVAGKPYREKEPEEIVSVEYYSRGRGHRVDMTQQIKSLKTGRSDAAVALASVPEEEETNTDSYAVMTYTNKIWFLYDINDVDSGASKTVSANTNLGGSITWTSSDESIATVSVNGSNSARVFGVKSGVAIITAALDNGEAASFTLYVTITDGIYAVVNNSLHLGVDGGMVENSEVKLWGYKSAGPAQLRQLWKIQHVERDYYSIRSAYRHGLALRESGGDVLVAPLDTALAPKNTPLNFQWRIFRSGSSYVFQYVGTSSLTLRPADGDTSPGADVTVTNVNPVDQFKWSLTWKTVQNQILLINTQNGLPATNAVRNMTVGQSRTLADLNLTASFVSRHTNAQDITWTSSDDTAVTVNGTTGTVTVILGGQVTITANRSFNGTVHTVSYTVSAPSVDPLHPTNIEFLRQVRITGTNWGGASTDHTITVVKSKLSTDTFFTATDNINGQVSRCYAISSNLRDQLNSLEAGYQDGYSIIPAFDKSTDEEKAAHGAKGETDQLVEQGYFAAESDEYYGVWAYNYTSLLELSNWLVSAIDTATRAYNTYLMIKGYYYSWQKTVNTGSLYVTSSEYGSTASYLDDIDDAANYITFSQKTTISAEERNAYFVPKNYNPLPYQPGTPVIEGQISSFYSPTYVRVYSQGNNGPVGHWFMRYSDIQGLTPKQVQAKYALQWEPTHYCYVDLPAGTTVYAGMVNESSTGAVQFEILGDLLESWFTDSTPWPW